MAASGRTTIFLVIALLILGTAAPAFGDSREFIVVRGIVEYADKEILTVGRNRHNITGVPVLNMDGTVSDRGAALLGKLAEIVYRKGKIVSVKVSPPMPE